MRLVVSVVGLLVVVDCVLLALSVPTSARQMRLICLTS